jgi:hypothetical protein
MICAWIETSSAETGSSPTISSGFSASARAMPMRWRCPPESGDPVAALLRVPDTVDHQGLAHDLAGRHARI